MAKRSYSDREKAEALAILDSNGGNLAKTSRESGIPQKTLSHWRDGNGTTPDVANIRDEKKADLITLWQGIVEKALSMAPDKIHEAGFDSLIRAAGIGTDKIANLRESQEGGIDDLDDAETDELKPEQIEAFARIIRAEAA